MSYNNRLQGQVNNIHNNKKKRKISIFFFYIVSLQKNKVFANRYYYEGSHGIVSLLFSSAHLFNLPSSNKQIGSHH